MNLALPMTESLCSESSQSFFQIDLKRNPKELSTSVTILQSDPIIGYRFVLFCKTSEDYSDPPTRADNLVLDLRKITVLT